MYLNVVCNSMQLCMIAIVPRRYDIPGVIDIHVHVLVFAHTILIMLLGGGPHRKVNLH